MSTDDQQMNAALEAKTLLLDRAVQKLPDVLEATITAYVGPIIDSTSQLREDMDPGEYVLRPSMEEYEAFKGFIRRMNHRDDIKFQLVLPRGLKEVGEYAFYWCRSLASVTLPHGLKKVGVYAFYWCTSLTHITWPRELKELGKCAFGGCTSLAVVNLPHGLKKVEENTFLGCKRLNSVTLPKGLQEVGWAAFSACRSLKSVTLPEGLEEVGDHAFGECDRLEIVYVPKNMVLDRKRLGINPGVKITHRISKRSHCESTMSNKRPCPSS